MGGLRGDLRCNDRQFLLRNSQNREHQKYLWHVVARNKTKRREITKPQTETVNNLWF